MKSWYHEDWKFRIGVVAVGKDNKPTNCRMGYEPGDSFTCQYGCPQDFCSKSMMKIFPILEVVRSDGDLQLSQRLRSYTRCDGSNSRRSYLQRLLGP